MRVTIEVDEKSGAVSTDPSASAAGVSAGEGQSSSAIPPVEVLALAAATGAINGGPAPTFSAPAAGPHPFVSRGGGQTETAHAEATSAGAANYEKASA